MKATYLTKAAAQIIAALAISLFPSFALAESIQLFSDEEGAVLSLSISEWHEAVSLQSSSFAARDAQPYSVIQDGPLVSIVDPAAAGKRYKADIPVSLLIYLKSHTAPIDIDSLSITGKRGIFSLDITDRLTPFLRKSVAGEDADYVIEGQIDKLRGGRYMVVFSLADVYGNYEERSIFLEVSDSRQ